MLKPLAAQTAERLSGSPEELSQSEQEASAALPGPEPETEQKPRPQQLGGLEEAEQEQEDGEESG